MSQSVSIYSELRSVELGWLSEIPSHWDVKKIKYVGEILIGLTYSPNDICDPKDGTLVLRSSNIQNGSLSLKDNVYVSKEIPKKLLTKVGDILICSRNGSRALVGKNILIDKTSTGVSFGAFMSVCRSEYNCYVAKVFNSALFDYQAGSYLTSTINQLTTGTLNGFEIPFPPPSEQQKIANFLDHETAKIDTLIEKQQQLIKLLKEKRQAVISHAVTKGLNPDAPMKDSDVEWLGEVPEHWITRRLKFTSHLQSGIPKGKDLTGKEQISVPMLRVANVQDSYLSLGEVHLMNIEPSQLERYSLRKGDVLMNEGGDNDKLGRGAVWEGEIEPCIHQNHVFAIRPYQVEPYWLDILTRAEYAKFHFYRVAKQSTNLASISSTNIKETPLLIPPKEERREIIEHISIMTKKTDLLIQKCHSQVRLAKERRTALISAAVTGKIDVRNWQPPADTSSPSMDA